MNPRTTVNLDGFERWAGRLALFLMITSPLVLVGPLILYSGHQRIVAGAYCIVSFFVGCVVTYALRWFKTNLSFAIMLTECAFYAMSANTIAVFIDEFITIGISMGLVAGNAFCIGIYAFIGVME